MAPHWYPLVEHGVGPLGNGFHRPALGFPGPFGGRFGTRGHGAARALRPGALLPLGRGAARYTFSTFAVSLPGLRHAAEDWLIEPAPAGSRLIWTMAIEARPLVTPMMWATGPLIRLVQWRAMRAIQVHVGN